MQPLEPPFDAPDPRGPAPRADLSKLLQRGPRRLSAQAPRRAHDPAPSRLSYRMQRVMLTPGMPRLLKWGVPLSALALVAGAWFALPSHRQQAADSYAELKRTIQSQPAFMVSAMSISGASDVIAEDIREITGLTFPLSSFDLDLPELRGRIEGLDAVKSAALTIREGNILDVAVTPRVPAFVWRNGEALTLLDAEGARVIDIAARAERPGLPLLAGVDADLAAEEALAVLRAAGPLGARLRGLVRVGGRRWDMALDRGQVIRLPETAPIAALKQVMALDASDQLLARDVTVIDMRNPARPTFRLGATALPRMEAIRKQQFGESR